MGARAHVLVTRSSHQASELAQRLRELGVEPVLIPAIETVEPSSFAALDDAVAALASDGGAFDWLVFTSANAVEVFRRRSAARTAVLPPTIRVAVIGAATARAVASAGIRVDVVPAQAVAEALTVELLPYAQQPDGRPTRFLLVRAEQAREYLPEKLRAAGAEIVSAPAYRTVIPAASVDGIRQLFGGATGSANRIEAITFTSSSTARNLLEICDTAEVRVPEEAQRVSIGPITSQTMRELGIPPHAEAPEATLAALAESVVKSLRNRERG